MSETEPVQQPPSTAGRAGCFILILILLAGGGWWWWNHRPSGDAPPPRMGKGMRGAARGVVPVAVEEVKRENFEEWLNISGTVTPLNVVTVRSRVDGELKKVHFTEGQLVNEGDLLAEIDPRPFQVQLNQAAGALKRDEALLENARTDLERYTALLKENSIERQKVDTQASLVRQYEASIVSDKAAVASADLQLEYTRIKAPIAGRVGLRQVDAGNIIHTGDAGGLVVITQIKPIGLVFSIPQDRVAAVRKRMAVSESVPVEAVDKEMNAVLGKGKLLAADNQIDLASGTLKLKAELSNEDGALFPNQFVIVRLLVGVVANATVAPATAIQRGARGAYAYVLADGGTVSLRQISTGASRGDRMLILDGLQPGDKVVTQGVDLLRDGAKVEVITPGVPLQPAPTEEKSEEKKQDGSRRGKGPPPVS